MATVDKARVLAMFKRKRGKFVPLMVSAMNRGGVFFIGEIQRKYYSGRPGLRVQTNALRGGWFPKTTAVKGDIITKVQPGHAAEAYAKIHDKAGRPNVIHHPGTPNGFGRGIRIPPHIIQLKARTDVEGYFERRGKSIWGKEIRQALRRWAA